MKHLSMEIQRCGEVSIHCTLLPKYIKEIFMHISEITNAIDTKKSQNLSVRGNFVVVKRKLII